MRKKMRCLVTLLIVVTIFSVGCSGTPNMQDNKPAVTIGSDQTKEESEEPKPRKATALENQIAEYMNEIWDGYEAKYSIDKAEALVYIDTSKEFKKPIIEIYRAFCVVQNLEIGFVLSDAEIDTLGIRRLKDIGFSEKDGKWYYDKKVVDVGNPLPVPDSMKPKEAEQGKEIEVTMEVEGIVSELKALQVYGKTNLPDGMELMISVECSSQNYLAQDKVVISNGEFTSSWFSDGKRPANRLADGKYILEITSPTASVQPPAVKEILGENAKNLKGNLVQFDQVFGNMIEYKKTINVK